MSDLPPSAWAVTELVIKSNEINIGSFLKSRFSIYEILAISVIGCILNPR